MRAAVEESVAAALAEDLAGGVDVTSVATIPADDEAVADSSRERWASSLACRSRRPCCGSRPAGSSRSTKASSTACASSRARSSCRRRGATRSLLTAERTALNLLCHLSGIATLTRALGRRGRGHRRGDPRHPQDDAGPARAGEVRGAVRRRREPPHVAVRCRAWSRTTTSSPPAGWRPHSGRCAHALPERAGRGRVRHRRPGRRGDRRRRRPDPARQHVAGTTCGPRSQLVRERGSPCSRPPAASPCESAADVAATGVDYLSVGALTHSAPVLDIGVDLRP